MTLEALYVGTAISNQAKLAANTHIERPASQCGCVFGVGASLSSARTDASGCPNSA